MSVPDSAETRDGHRLWAALPFDWWFELDEGWQASLIGLAIVAIVYSQELMP